MAAKSRARLALIEAMHAGPQRRGDDVAIWRSRGALDVTTCGWRDPCS